MSELTARLTLYSAVDARVLAMEEVDPHRQDPFWTRLENVLGPYATPVGPSPPRDRAKLEQGRAAGWSDRLKVMLAGKPEVENISNDVNDVNRALDEMTEANARISTADAARRLYSIWMILRLLDDQVDHGRAAATLAPIGLIGSDEAVLERLASAETVEDFRKAIEPPEPGPLI